jgi:RecA-family ATPase
MINFRRTFGRTASNAPGGCSRTSANRVPASRSTNAATPKCSTRWPSPLDLEALAEREPAAPAFLIPDWLPTGYATLLAGHGGAGKSQVALMLAVCLASGRPFFGMPVKRSRVLVIDCEDRENVVHWRLARLCAHLGVDLASLRGMLDIIDLVGHDAILWASPDREGRALTAAYGALVQRIEAQQSQVLIVDGISDTFGGNENARSDVKRYVNALLALISPDTGALLLVGHVDKSTAKTSTTGEGYSGSTGWHNAVRARWYLHPETRDSDEGAERTGELLLELQKSNLGRTDQSIRLAWDDAAHVLAAKTEGTGFVHLDRVERERGEETGVLAALLACSARGYVPAAMTGPRTAYNVLSAAAEFPDTLRSAGGKSRFKRLLERLRHRGDIIETSHMRGGKDRHPVQILAISDQCGECR